MSEPIVRTTVEIPLSLIKDTKLILTEQHGNPHGHFKPLIIELLQQWVKENKE